MSESTVSEAIAKQYGEACNRVAKWRTVFVGWQVGTKPMGTPGLQALRDEAEGRILMRVECNALAALLIEKGVFTADEFRKQIVVECEEYCQILEQRFPGYSATPMGMHVDTAKAMQTHQRLDFPA